MPRVYVSEALRLKVAEDARHRCGYCLTAQEFTAMPLHVEHFIRARRRWVLAGWHPPEL